MDVTKEAVADRLDGMMWALKIDGPAFGGLVDASASLVSNWVRAKHFPPVTKMWKLCEKEGVSLDWIYRGVVVTATDSHLAGIIAGQRAVRSQAASSAPKSRHPRKR